MPDDAKIAKAENYDATFADCVVQSEIWGNLQCGRPLSREVMFCFLL